ncbi:MAG: HAMP domain-containing protein [Burkholderiaceae bacterium]|nr:HAMP domain-containing protein [Burkholderiaceae bacterium]
MAIFEDGLNKIMQPCTRLMESLGFRNKLFLIAATVALPLIFLCLNLLSAYRTEHVTAAMEADGVKISRLILAAITDTQKIRDQQNGTAEATTAALRTQLKKNIALIDAELAANTYPLLKKPWETLHEALNEIAEAKTSSSPNSTNDPSREKRPTKAVEQSHRFLELTTEATGLVLDPEASSYFLMLLSTQKIPLWLERISQMRALSNSLSLTEALNERELGLLRTRAEVVNLSALDVDEGGMSLMRAGEQAPKNLTAALNASKNLVSMLTSDRATTSNTMSAKIYQDTTAAFDQTLQLQMEALNQLDTELQKRKKSSKSKLFLTSSLVVFALLLTAYLAYGFYRVFARDMATVNSAVTAVAAGNLTLKISTEGKDELGNMGRTLENMNSQLSALVANVRSSATMVANLGQSLSTGISDLAYRTEQQASNLEETSASVKDLAETVKKNADSARAVSSMAANVRLIAESSGDTMKSAVASMNDIQNSALKVQDIVSMIDRIAFQTDILALNAAVEASHAGEHGRGFAVVATEVRALAQRSADAARQIRRLIEESVTKVENGVYQIDEVNLTLSDILNGIRNLAKDIDSISIASNEQSNGLAQISAAILDLEEITNRNGRMADEAKQASGELEGRAQTLNFAVSTFKLRQGTADEALKLVRAAEGLYKVAGDACLERITADVDKQFADRDMYVFAVDTRGVYRAFAGNAAKLGANIGSVPGVDGPKFLHDAFSVPAGGGWIDYSIVNPTSGKVDVKTSFMICVSDNLALGCGVYKLV